MLKNIISTNFSIGLVSLLAIFITSSISAQGMSGGKERSENVYLEASRHEEQETHYKYSFKVPVAKSGNWSHSLSGRLLY